jgi:hypothetical protein
MTELYEKSLELTLITILIISVCKACAYIF